MNITSFTRAVSGATVQADDLNNTQIALENYTIVNGDIGNGEIQTAKLASPYALTVISSSKAVSAADTLTIGIGAPVELTPVFAAVCVDNWNSSSTSITLKLQSGGVDITNSLSIDSTSTSVGAVVAFTLVASPTINAQDRITVEITYFSGTAAANLNISLWCKAIHQS